LQKESQDGYWIKRCGFLRKHSPLGELATWKRTDRGKSSVKKRSNREGTSSLKKRSKADLTYSS
jgi:hypothetical protein